ncbi:MULTISPECIES: SMP-30/gluconolactonase/LRE family protein [Halocynthiibacter]|uniref:SMP-30/gluconolactonase/LRE family protein n=1 Tax=Halocynthiibacter halioticoli TaxID=2986804 RepID=A0AAE3IZU7_9RHOB|nr:MULTISPECIES: SMP-30/gluconolactonase/LRE family protein [Halocynthiibacter]MCV6825382.1 SMP-30/gluconolactonase/LRE family protein [Halocynthiibacter halioticoli]MCW4058383.1 SMP-30/gluconolactonase/LRE family protein [Halocynthiibacter sp. SDUM655004]
MTHATLFDDRQCTLGEGPLWHPKREQFFWFDILEKKLYSKDETGPLEWEFDECVSAAGWVDHSTLLIASETSLFLFDVDKGEKGETLAQIEADNEITRSNDGRADPFGGFWIGTMGYDAEPNAGAIYRYYKGEVRCIFPEITITNAICFSPDGKFAYFCDTAEKVIRRQKLNQENGWPTGPSEVWLDFTNEDFGADGAVVDSRGCLWNAQWGANRVACYSPEGVLLETIAVPDASQTSCPAFGGKDLTDLLVTTARVLLSDEALAKEPLAGSTFISLNAGKGQAEHQVKLP